jgi:hypothetical protein
MARELERGDVFFFYRPRVGVTEVRSLDDVARFVFVLDPDAHGCDRLLVVGRKRLPDPERHERAWALVAEVTQRPDELRDDLEARTYETRTRGLRQQPGARPVGEGRYVLADHDGHSHLAYALELPAEPGEAQRLFNLHREASFIVAVRNPDSPAPPGTGLPRSRRADLPRALRDRFGDRRWLPVDDPAMLDHPGIELVLIGAAEQVEEELGIRLDTEAETLETSELLADLRLRPGDVPTTVPVVSPTRE